MKIYTWTYMMSIRPCTNSQSSGAGFKPGLTIGNYVNKENVGNGIEAEVPQENFPILDRKFICIKIHLLNKYMKKIHEP